MRRLAGHGVILVDMHEHERWVLWLISQAMTSGQWSERKENGQKVAVVGGQSKSVQCSLVLLANLSVQGRAGQGRIRRVNAARENKKSVR